MSKVELKKQNWNEFDVMLEKLSGNGKETADDYKEISLGQLLKTEIKGNEVMTDKQHKYLVALFSCELQWEPERSFMFAIKIIPGLKQRLSKKILREYDLSALYRQLKKREAIKLINILKSIKDRKK